MSWDSNATIDWDELGSIIRLLPSAPTAMDIQMVFTSPKGAIEGEGVGENKYLLPIFGYAFKAQRKGATVDSSIVAAHAFWVIRNVDAASASLMSVMLKPGGKDKFSSVSVYVFKSGDQVAGMERQPMIEFNLGNAVIAFHSIVTAGNSGTPVEVLSLSFDDIEVNTAPQQDSGLRGALRSAKFN